MKKLVFVGGAVVVGIVFAAAHEIYVLCKMLDAIENER